MNRSFFSMLVLRRLQREQHPCPRPSRHSFSICRATLTGSMAGLAPCNCNQTAAIKHEPCKCQILRWHKGRFSACGFAGPGTSVCDCASCSAEATFAPSRDASIQIPIRSSVSNACMCRPKMIVMSIVELRCLGALYYNFLRFCTF